MIAKSYLLFDYLSISANALSVLLFSAYYYILFILSIDLLSYELLCVNFLTTLICKVGD